MGKSHNPITNTEQNIACAELEGWTELQLCPDPRLAWSGITGVKANGKAREAVPSYREDLNACARLVAKLTDEQRYRYHTHLFMFFHPWADPIDACAPQRVEAILRATGKRKDA